MVKDTDSINLNIFKEHVLEAISAIRKGYLVSYPLEDCPPEECPPHANPNPDPNPNPGKN